MEQITVSLKDTAKALGISRPTVYKLIHEGKLATFMIGSRRLTTPQAIRNCIQSCEQKEIDKSTLNIRELP